MTDRVGQQLGNYSLIRLIGRGGFADVYLGEHIYLKTPAAIKVLQTRLSSESDMEGFLNEARTIARLIHPNIVRVLDFGVHEETPFLVMDYAPNGTLRQRYEKGVQLPVATIVPYVNQIAEALQHAHDEKLIHRDIKQENMLIGKRNEILLSDFGIALMAQSSRYQSTQDVVGTVAYMSPEQIQGRPRPASDQYSLAVVVYEWLSGDRPFHGSFTELCTQHMFASPPPLQDRVPGIDPAVAQVVSIALAKDPKQRFGSVRAFANALEQAAGGKNVVLPPPTVPTPTPAPPANQPSQPIARTVAVTPPSPPVHLTPPAPLITPSAPYVQQGARGYAPPPPPVPVYPQQQPYPGYQPQQFYPYPQPLPPQRAEQPKKSGWGIGKREWLALAISLAMLSLFATILVGPAHMTFIGPISAQAILLLAIGETIPLFFAAAFGPWVGLFQAANAFIGGFIFFSLYASSVGGSYSFDMYIRAIGQGWALFLGIGVVGFVVGLARVATGGRYKHIGALLLADALAAGSIILATLLVITLVPHGSYFDVGQVLGPVLLYSLPGLVLLPIVLLLYSLIAFPRQHT